MSDPYEVLGVQPDADEAELRQRYLELVPRLSAGPRARAVRGHPGGL